MYFDAVGLPPGLSIAGDTGIVSGVIDPSAVSTTPYSVTITATDYTPATATTASQTFPWTVSYGPPSVSLDTPDNQTNSVGDRVDVVLNASDAGAYPLTYTARGLPAGLTLDPVYGEITGVISTSAARSTPYTVTILASDGQVGASKSFTWAISGITLAYAGDPTNIDGDTVSLAPTVTDTTASPTYTYSETGTLPPGVSFSTSTGVLAGVIASTADSTTPYAVTITATDGTYSRSQTVNWQVNRLTLTPPDNRSNLEGATVSWQLAAADNVATPTYTAVGLPTGLTITSAGLISGVIGVAAHGLSPYLVTVTAADGTSSSSQSFIWSVTPQIALASPGPQMNAAGDAVSLTLIATDRASGTLTYSAAGLVAGLTLNTTTGAITGTIASSAISGSPHVVTFTATDGTHTSTRQIAWNVSAMTLPAPGDQASLDNAVISLAMAATYHGTGTVVYSALALPTGLSISPSTGLISGTISGTADANGPFAVVVTATVGTLSVSQSFNWFVRPRVTLDPVDDQISVPGVAIVPLTLSGASGGPGSPTVTYSSTALPAGLSLNNATGTISGVVTAAVSGTSQYKKGTP